MAPETYYYFFSIISVLGTMLYLVNLVLLRVKGRTTFGLAYKPGTSEHERVVKLARDRNLTIVSILELVFISNLVNSIIRVVRLNTPDAYFILIFAPIFSILLFTIMVIIVRKQLNNYLPGKHN
jgi:hypothetical protein